MAINDPNAWWRLQGQPPAVSPSPAEPTRMQRFKALQADVQRRAQAVQGTQQHSRWRGLRGAGGGIVGGLASQLQRYATERAGRRKEIFERDWNVKLQQLAQAMAAKDITGPAAAALLRDYYRERSLAARQRMYPLYGAKRVYTTKSKGRRQEGGRRGYDRGKQMAIDYYLRMLARQRPQQYPPQPGPGIMPASGGATAAAGNPYAAVPVRPWGATSVLATQLKPVS